MRLLSRCSMSWFAPILLMVFCAASLSCAPPPADNGANEGFNVGENNNDGEPGELDVEFILKNDTNTEVMTQRAMLPAPGWLSVNRDGEELTVKQDCGLPCPCDEDYCIECDMAPPTVEPLEPGEELSFGWDGTEYAVAEYASCYEEVSVDPTEPLEAEICYGFDVAKTEFDEHVDDPICETVEFIPGSDDEVVITVDEGPDPVDPDPVDFVLENETSQPLYYQTENPGPIRWLSVREDGESFRLTTSCLDCLCENDHCAVCDAMPTPQAREIAPGDDHSRSWDGTRYVFNTDDNPGCYEEARVTDGMFEVEICYGFEVEEADFGGTEIVDPACETVEFELGVDEEVAVTVEEGPVPHPVDSIEFAVENDTDDTVYIQRATLPAPGWMDVVRDGEPLHISYDCGVPCPCDSPDACAVCDMMPPHVDELQPGDEQRRSWDGIEYAIVDNNGDTCHETVPVDGETLTVEICYGFDVEHHDSGDEYVANPICERHPFQFGVDEEIVVTAD